MLSLATDILQPVANTFFRAFVGGLVVAPVFQIIWQTLHVGNFGLEIVRVLVAVTVAKVLFMSPVKGALRRCNGTGSAAVRSTSC